LLNLFFKVIGVERGKGSEKSKPDVESEERSKRLKEDEVEAGVDIEGEGLVEVEELGPEDGDDKNNGDDEEENTNDADEVEKGECADVIVEEEAEKAKEKVDEEAGEILEEEEFDQIEKSDDHELPVGLAGGCVICCEFGGCPRDFEPGDDIELLNSKSNLSGKIFN